VTVQELPTPKAEGVFARWVLRPIKQQLTQGTSPRKIAQAIACGLTFGIFPIIGSTTLLTIAFGVPLRLNQPILQVFKTLATPLQWIFILGFYRLGEWLFRADPVSLSIPNMISEFAEAPLAFFLKYGMTALYGIAVWCLLAPLLILALHASIRPLIERLSRSLAKT
jgi:uncharacterized protein (DUF2062 family)